MTKLMTVHEIANGLSITQSEDAFAMDLHVESLLEQGALQDALLIVYNAYWGLACALLELVDSSEQSSFSSEVNNAFKETTDHCVNKIRNTSRDDCGVDLNDVRNRKVNYIFSAFKDVLEKLKFCKVI